MMFGQNRQLAQFGNSCLWKQFLVVEDGVVVVYAVVFDDESDTAAGVVKM